MGFAAADGEHLLGNVTFQTPVGMGTSTTPTASLEVVGANNVLFVCLHREDVGPTNNSSERDLHPPVIHRKVIGSFRSDWSAEASAIRTIILATARKQGQSSLDAFRAVAGPSPLQVIPTPT